MSDSTIFDVGKAADDDEIAFDYLKSPNFRTVWVDGLIGSITPKGLIHCALYAERPAIPRRQVYKVDKVDQNTGTLGEEVIEKQLSRGSIIREMALDAVMTADVAESMAKWLLDRAKELRDREGEK